MTIKTPEQGWADKITKVVIERDGDATHPWHLWGRDYETGLVTEEVWDFPTFSEAVAAIPAFFAAAHRGHLANLSQIGA